MTSILIPIFIVSWVIGLVWVLVYQRQLKTRFPDVHADIFRDQIHKKIKNDWRLFLFLARGKFRSIEDSEFVRHSELLRWFILAFPILLLLTFFSLI